jgi:hypothetical protein
MWRKSGIFAWFLGVAIVLEGVPGAAQQVTVGTPFHTLSGSYFSRTGTNWHLNIGGIPFNFGGGQFINPPFGNPNPNAGLNSGFAILGKNVQGYFNWTAGQGAQRTAISDVPSVTLMNGQQAFISDTSQTPFVISQIPVVGGFAPIGVLHPVLPPDPYASPYRHLPSALQARMEQLHRQMAAEEASEARGLPLPPRRELPRPRGTPPAPDRKPAKEPTLTPAESSTPLGNLGRTAEPSSATLAVPSVADARRLHARERQAGEEEVQALWERGQAAEEDGKPNVAKIYYEMVVRRAAGELKERAQARLQALREGK